MIITVTREKSYRKCNIRSYSKKEFRSKAWQSQVFNKHRFLFSFSRQHRFGSVLNRCGLAKRIAKIDLAISKVRGFIFSLKFSHRDLLTDFLNMNFSLSRNCRETRSAYTCFTLDRESKQLSFYFTTVEIFIPLPNFFFWWPG